MRLNYFIRFALFLSFAYHGWWNLSSEGAAWWASDNSTYPVFLRYIIGLAELAAALSMLTGVLYRLAALLMCPILLGAIYNNFGNGFSYKENGYEVALIMFMMCLGLFLQEHELKT